VGYIGTTFKASRLSVTMASHQEQSDLDRIRAELEHVKLENARLKLESEITGIERELELHANTSTSTSTPKPLFAKAPMSVTFKCTETPTHGDNYQPDEAMSPGRFITTRRKGIPRALDETQGKSKPSVMMKPATYDGTGSWQDYKAHFDACAKINKWTESEMGLYLAVSLRGQAQGVFGNLPAKAHDYSALVQALQERFLPPNQTELYRVQLRERRQRASEQLSELAQDIRRLTNLAYPTAPADVRETLAKEQFIDSLHSTELRICTKQARPISLNDAVQHAVEMDAFYRAEKKTVSSCSVDTF
jgi:hypothetical protein